MRVAFYTLGCKVNHYETQAMEELFVQAGYSVVPYEEPSDIYIVNTCTVTQISDRKSRQILSRAKAKNPNAFVVAVGCYAETAREQLETLSGVDLVLGTDGRRDIVSIVEGQLKYSHTAPFERRVFEELSATRDSRTRATLKIQDGCNSFCSYCIIPYARGALRSRTMESCERELRALAESGYREVVLTGIQLTAYGVDLPNKPDLCDVIRLADGIQGIDRIRLGSLEPRFITERFIEMMLECKALCPQFHLSLQSGSDGVLQRMNRRYSVAEYRRAAKLLYSALPNCAITTDVIAGFVGETEDEHAETKAFLEEMRFARIHVFPYSIRKGTKAAAMDGHLPKAIKERRASELIGIGQRLEEAYIDRQIGRTVRVLMEDDGTGFTDNYVRVRCEGECGTMRLVTITKREGNLALAE